MQRNGWKGVKRHGHRCDSALQKIQIKMGCVLVWRENALKFIMSGKWEGWWDTKFWSNIRTMTLKKRIRKVKENPKERGVRDTLWRAHLYIQGVCYGFLIFTLYPVPSPGSHTAAETSFTSKSCTSPMLSPMLSKPSWRTLREGTSTATSKPRTLPKFRRNCTTIRQSENVPPSRTRPGMRGSSGKGWKAKKKNVKDSVTYFKSYFFNNSWENWLTLPSDLQHDSTGRYRNPPSKGHPLPIQCWNTFQCSRITEGKRLRNTSFLARRP